ncbi:MAG: magnesium/cobalt transporter CorA [Cyclobacteriaceae bacterium]|jgi:magnesium transporter|nr:magnesium/cobalt transporter CorA [Cyclobacteriaceae bacterium]
MIRAYTLTEGKIFQHKNPAFDEWETLPNVIWIDLQSPSQEEKEFIERLYKIEFFTSQEVQEIESSSRFLETDTTIEINLGFLQNGSQELSIQNVTFILVGNVLITYRQGDLKTFAETVRRLKAGGSLEKKEHGLGVFLTLLEARIDSDADLIEGINRRLNQFSKELIARKALNEDLLLGIAQQQENVMLLHQTITEKQRVVASLLRIDEFTPLQQERLKIIIKDVASLLQHSQFSSERLEYMQNTFLGLVNIEQNTVIKIFTVVTVVFMPPTLIASIYGMNFQHMPELQWVGGYPSAIGLMLLSSLAFLWYFKRKKWL